MAVSKIDSEDRAPTASRAGSRHPVGTSTHPSDDEVGRRLARIYMRILMHSHTQEIHDERSAGTSKGDTDE